MSDHISETAAPAPSSTTAREERGGGEERRRHRSPSRSRSRERTAREGDQGGDRARDGADKGREGERERERPRDDRDRQYRSDSYRSGSGRDDSRRRDDRDRSYGDGGRDSRDYRDSRDRYTSRDRDYGRGGDGDRYGGGGYGGGDRDRGYGGGGGYHSSSSSRGGGRDYSGSAPSSSSGGASAGGAGPSRREGRPRRSKEEEEVYQLTRDARTIFVGQLVVRAAERDIQTYFEQVGPVVDVQLIRDKASGRSKGFGYVEFEELEAVPKALLLNGQKFCMKHPACVCSGFPVLVKPSEAEKNYAALAEAAGGSALSATNERRVYLGNVAPLLTEGDLKQIAEAIAPVDRVAIIRDDRGASKGVAVITYSAKEGADRATATLHGIDVGGRRIKAGRLNAMGEVATPEGETFQLDAGSGHALSAQARAALAQQLAGATTSAAQALGSTLLAASGAGYHAGAAGGSSVIPGITPSSGSAMTGVLGPVGSLPATAAVPMSGTASIPGTAGGTALVPPRGVPTTCILLKNVFDASLETAPNWDLDLRREMQEEASRFGPVVHVHVTRDSPGWVHVMFADVGVAVTAATALNGRTFAGRSIGVEYVPLPAYVSRFPEVASMV